MGYLRGRTSKRLWLSTILLVLAVAVAIAVAVPYPIGASPPPDPGRLLLHNRAFDSVRVQVRLGPETDCDANALLGTYTLPRDRTWGISGDEVICWRREANPTNPTGTWTPWSSQTLAAGAVVDVDL